MPADGEEQQRRETLWKLVDTQCAQLADSVAGARRPFLLALTWAFIWASALYSFGFGDNKYMAAHYAGLSRLVEAEKEDREELLKVGSLHEKSLEKDKMAELEKKIAESKEKIDTYCRDLSPQSSSIEIRTSRCRNLIADADKLFKNAHHEAMFISLPGSLGKFSIGDLAIVGQFGLLLILSWSFFATRRENHAVRAFVDMDAHSRNTTGWFPVTYILEPRAKLLLAEHFAYAYRSVAQRFVFIFSQHSKPLFAFAGLLTVIPVLVASWNAYTDLQDTFRLIEFKSGLFPVRVYIIKIFIEIVLLVLVWLITYQIIRYDLETSTLLNGWELAARDVWMANWDATGHPPGRVKIDVRAQTATPSP